MPNVSNAPRRMLDLAKDGDLAILHAKDNIAKGGEEGCAHRLQNRSD
jgi:hypothetical protein